MSVEVISFGNPIDGADDGIDKAILEMCIKITGQAVTFAPTGETGHLKQSIMYKTGTGQESSSGVTEPIEVSPKRGEGYVGSNIKYAIYQEYGTRYMKPQPFLRPSIAIYGLGKPAQDIMLKKQREEMKGSLSKTKRRVNFFSKD